MSIASLLHQQTTNIVNQSHKLMTLYQTKRTKVWYKYPLLRCGLLRSQHECVIVQLPTPTPATPKGIKDEEANEEGVKMKLECVSSEQLNQCLRIESRGLYGNKGIYIKVSLYLKSTKTTYNHPFGFRSPITSNLSTTRIHPPRYFVNIL